MKKRALAAALLLAFLLPTLCQGAESLETEDVGDRLEAIKQTIRKEEVGKYGMLPIYPRDVAEGTYAIDVDSNSSFFKITAAELTAEGETLTARITISSLSYQYVYLGTAQEAAADEGHWIEAEEVDGRSIFTFPLEALDKVIPCAAFSKKRQIWYDRDLVFDASTLPAEALLVELPDYDLIEAALRAYDPEGETTPTVPTEPAPTETPTAPQPVALNYPDGEYSIEVNMTGGSGRASVSSPTLLTVREGKAYAKLLWSSAYYDYMILGDQTYYNLTTDGGNSTFEIPITALDAPMTVIADTTAMGDPVEIQYTLTFYEDSIEAKGNIPQEAAKKVLVIAGIIILAGGLLNHAVKKRRK